MLYKESIGKVNFGFKSTDDNKSIRKYMYKDNKHLCLVENARVVEF